MSKPIDQELLPCPFCGCQPKEYDQIGYSSVKCKPCGFSIKVKSMDGPPYAPELWNTRAAVQPAGGAVPEGWKLVPVELTKDMHAAMMDAKGSLFNVYRAMLAAAPHPASGNQKPTQK